MVEQIAPKTARVQSVVHRSPLRRSERDEIANAGKARVRRDRLELSAEPLKEPVREPQPFSTRKRRTARQLQDDLQTYAEQRRLRGSECVGRRLRDHMIEHLPQDGRQLLAQVNAIPGR